MLEAIVIGAGQAGLAASYHLARRGIEHLVLERGRVGETWRSQRWTSFVLNTPNSMSLLPGESDDPATRDAFLPRDAFIARLQAYVDRRKLPIRTGTTVTAVASHPGTGSFSVAIRTDAGPDELNGRTIVVASGGQRVPRIPTIARDLPAGIRQMPAADYRDPWGLPAGAVLVVGGAQTGVQVVEDLLAAGRTVYLCTSAVGRFPRRYRGEDVLDSLSRIGLFDIPIELLPDPSVRFLANPTLSGVGPKGHTVSLQGLAAQGAVLLGRPVGVRGGRIKLTPTVGANIALGDRVSAETKAQIDNALRAQGVPLPPLDPNDPADQAHPDPLSIPSPAELDLDAADVASVIWTTGFRGDFGYLPDTILDEAAQPVQVHGVTSLPGVFCLGLPWMARRRSGLISGVDGDAAFIVERLAEHLAASPSPG
jgi:putative flavoprotein involved in K+ transport